MKKRFGIAFLVFGVFFSFCVTLIFASLILNGSSSYNSTNVNITQENGYVHMNLSDSSIVLYLPFDYNYSFGEIYDYSNYSHNGTMHNFLDNYTISGKYGGAYRFDGSDDYIEVGYSSSLSLRGNFTISVWINPENLVSYHRILCSKNNDYCLLLNGNVLAYQILNLGQANVSNTTISPNVWTHVVFVFDDSGNNTKYYINSIKDSNEYIEGNVPSESLPNLIIGSHSTPSTQFFNGSIDELMIWNRTLNSTEVAAIYNNQSSRFLPMGEMLFQSNNLGTNETVNISLANCGILKASYIQAKINDGSFVNFSSCNITNYNATGNLTSANLTVKLVSGTNNFYSPLVIGNITLNSLDSVSPNVTISSPTNQTIYTSSSVSVSVLTNENSTCNYSTNAGVTNTSLTANSSGTGHTGTASSLSNSAYTANIYCSDLQGNLNNTQNVSFTVAVPPASASTEEETVGNGLGGTYKPGKSVLSKGYSVNMRATQKVQIPLEGENKIILIKEVSNSENRTIVSVNEIDYEIVVNDSKKIDLNSDGFYDVEILNNKVLGNLVNLKFTLIHEEIPSGKEEEQKENILEKIPGVVKNVNWKIYSLMGFLVVLILVVVLIRLKSKSKK